MATVERPREASRARYPDDEGYVERDGVRVFWEVYGDGEPTVFLLPSWSIVHSRLWKAQIAYLARHFRVLTFDGRGNGRSDRPAEAAAYNPMEFAHDAVAVMDATGTDSAVNVSISAGTTWSLIIAAMHPERVLGAVFISPTTYAVGDPMPDWMHTPFNERLESHEGANRYNRHFIREHFPEFAEYWSRLCLPEPHSTRPIEFGVEMGLDTTPEVVLATLDAVEMEKATTAVDRFELFAPMLRQLAAQVRCPVLVVQGEQDRICMPEWGRALAGDTGGELLRMPEAGHVPQARKPVRVNLALRAFVERVASSSG
jgi:pimeloyl-ACP methyl ester carboxylesterase